MVVVPATSNAATNCCFEREEGTGYIGDANAEVDGFIKACVDHDDFFTDIFGRIERIGELDVTDLINEEIVTNFRGVDEAVLDRVYEHDVALMDEVQALAEAIEALPSRGEELDTALPELLNQIDNLESQWSTRIDILKGLE